MYVLDNEVNNVHDMTGLNLIEHDSHESEQRSSRNHNAVPLLHIYMLSYKQ
jgi:hypothetical protein